MKSFLSLAILGLSLVSGYSNTNTTFTLISARDLTNKFRVMLNSHQFDTNAVPFTLTNFAGLTSFETSQFATNNGNVTIAPGAPLTNVVISGVTTVNSDTVVGNGLEVIVAQTNVSPQTASVSPTTFYTTPAAVNDYSVAGQIYTTTPAGSGSVTLSVVWTDQNGLRTNTSSACQLATTTAAASIVTLSVPYITCTNSSAVQFFTTVTSGGGAAYFTRLVVKRFK